MIGGSPDDNAEFWLDGHSERIGYPAFGARGWRSSGS